MRKAKSLVISSVVAGLFLALSAWSNNYIDYVASPTTETAGHLAEAGTSDGGVTAWTYARYYGPPARNSYAITASYLYNQSMSTKEEYGWEVRTYISTGALFHADTDDLGFSNVDTDYSGNLEAYAFVD